MRACGSDFEIYDQHYSVTLITDVDYDVSPGESVADGAEERRPRECAGALWCATGGGEQGPAASPEYTAEQGSS